MPRDTTGAFEPGNARWQVGRPRYRRRRENARTRWCRIPLAAVLDAVTECRHRWLGTSFVAGIVCWVLSRLRCSNLSTTN